VERQGNSLIGKSIGGRLFRTDAGVQLIEGEKGRKDRCCPPRIPVGGGEMSRKKKEGFGYLGEKQAIAHREEEGGSTGNY